MSVSAGREQNLAITADGSVWSWGYGGRRPAGPRRRSGPSGSRRSSRPLLASASSLCRLERVTASPAPATAPSLPGARARAAASATERTCRTSCYRRRSRCGRWGDEQARRGECEAGRSRGGALGLSTHVCLGCTAGGTLELSRSTFPRRFIRELRATGLAFWRSLTRCLLKKMSMCACARVV